MVKYCFNCGKEVGELNRFCLNCGAQLQSVPEITQPSQPVYATPQAPIQQGYTPIQPKKSNMKLIGALIAIIVVVVIIIVVVLVVFRGIGGPLSGEWKYESYGMTMYNKLNGDSSWEMAVEQLGQKTPFVKVGTWSSESDQICFTVTITNSGMGIYETGEQCYTYELTGNGSSLSLTSTTEGSYTWTKV